MFVLFAFLSAIGAHWFVLQSVAWTAMLADNLRTSSLQEAVGRTFDGKHPCKLCKQIAKEKQSEKHSEFSVKLNKFEFSYTPATFVFSAPSDFWEMAPIDLRAWLIASAPPVPPPRFIPV